MTNIYFVRHGETNLNKANENGESYDEIYNGTNISLNKTGKLQVQALSFNISPDAVFSSPLIRVKETAEIFCSNNKLEHTDIIYDDRLIEYSKGRFEGIDFVEISKKVGFDVKDTCLSCNYDFSCYGGDSATNIKSLVANFLNDIKSNYQDKTIICFTSGGIIRMVYFLLFNQTAPNMTKNILISNASVHHFTLNYNSLNI